MALADNAAGLEGRARSMIACRLSQVAHCRTLRRSSTTWGTGLAANLLPAAMLVGGSHGARAGPKYRFQAKTILRHTHLKPWTTVEGHDGGVGLPFCCVESNRASAANRGSLSRSWRWPTFCAHGVAAELVSIADYARRYTAAR
jgi:hypothetical protein